MPTLVSSGISNATQIINWVNSIGSSLISAGYSSDATPVPQIVIDNKLVIKNFVADNDLYVYFNGTYLGGIGRSYGNPKNIIVIYDNDLVYVEFIGTWGSSYGSARGVVLYSKTYGTLYGYVGYSYSTVSDGVIENMSITDASSGDIYSLQSVFRDYSMEVAHLDYTQKRLFKNGIKSTRVMPDFVDCSTVEPFKVYSFSGNSYYSVGYHTLIRVTIPIES